MESRNFLIAICSFRLTVCLSVSSLSAASSRVSPSSLLFIKLVSSSERIDEGSSSILLVILFGLFSSMPRSFDMCLNSSCLAFSLVIENCEAASASEIPSLSLARNICLPSFSSRICLFSLAEKFESLERDDIVPIGESSPFLSFFFIFFFAFLKSLFRAGTRPSVSLSNCSRVTPGRPGITKSLGASSSAKDLCVPRITNGFPPCSPP